MFSMSKEDLVGLCQNKQDMNFQPVLTGHTGSEYMEKESPRNNWLIQVHRENGH